MQRPRPDQRLLDHFPFLNKSFGLLPQLKSAVPIVYEHRLLQYLILDRLWKAVPQDDHCFAQSANYVLIAVRAIENAGLDFHSIRQSWRE